MYNSEFSILGLALGLGLLVGIQREKSGHKIAGIRTFALITLTGALCGLIARQYDGLLIIVGGLFAIALFNLVFKGGLPITIGSKRLRKLILTPFIIVLIFGVLVFFFWPEDWML